MSQTENLENLGKETETHVGFHPKRLNHAVLYVKDVTTSANFYTQLMNMEIVATGAGMSAAFLRIKGSDNHHDLGLIQIRSETKSRILSPGLYHLAWQVATIEELRLAKTVLTAHNSYHGEANHGATLSIYGYDPDGIDFEIMWMLPRDSWGAYENMAVVDYLNLDEALAKWSGVATA